ncbi:MAG: 16S rRNA (guanine(966)-N(2))-methyltransferase RsmD [Deltaproteobacteria bacterium]|nr:16S rRNA (guanine(966)-N(2))-methyltransferase RsmD [Deltaproteobacteria bacterium]
MGLKITGGIYKGRELKILNLKAVRYTSSKVRESVFNMVGDVTGFEILELFAGSGIFSLEAISRGAKLVSLVEKNDRMIDLIKKNVELLGVSDRCRIMKFDVKKAIPFLYERKNKYDIIFLDPPYDKGYVNGTLMMLKRYPLHREGGIIIIEHSKREKPEWSCYGELLTRKYGDTCVTLIWMKGAN